MLKEREPSASPALDVKALLQAELDEHRAAFEAAAQMLCGPFIRTLDVLEAGLRRSGKLMLFGNGGSAADAQHIAAELIVRYQSDRPAMAAIALTTDSSALTACGNDLGFEALYERQIAGLGRLHDVAVGISTSGRSPNVLNGLQQARSMGLATVGLTGGSGGEMRAVCDALIVVPSRVTARIQELHILIGHVWCKALEQRLGLV
jgi:D-sedoheptulose 7-phosphate isomerase